jgi:hypothetical protein
MSSRPATKEFEEFARDCVRLAGQADTPELREKLLNLAREWMRAVMDDEDLALRTRCNPGAPRRRVGNQGLGAELAYAAHQPRPPGWT